MVSMLKSFPSSQVMELRQSSLQLWMGTKRGFLWWLGSSSSLTVPRSSIQEGWWRLGGVRGVKNLLWSSYSIFISGYSSSSLTMSLDLLFFCAKFAILQLTALSSVYYWVFSEIILTSPLSSLSFQIPSALKNSIFPLLFIFLSNSCRIKCKIIYLRRAHLIVECQEVIALIKMSQASRMNLYPASKRSLISYRSAFIAFFIFYLLYCSSCSGFVSISFFDECALFIFLPVLSSSFSFCSLPLLSGLGLLYQFMGSSLISFKELTKTSNLLGLETLFIKPYHFFVTSSSLSYFFKSSMTNLLVISMSKLVGSGYF